jgi:thioredoxin reductase
MQTQVYDYVIIGAGISGLYTAYKLKKKDPKCKFLILEKQKTIGGRAGSDLFYKTNVLSGAGVGRKRKDKKLLQLLKEFSIPVQFYRSKIESIGFDRINLIEIMNELKNKFEKNQTHITFKKFAIKHLGIKLYHQFVLSSGYTDYENDDVENTLYNYGMEDNVGNWKAFSVPWKKLILSIANHIGNKNIKTKQNVISIRRKLDCFLVKTKSNKIIKTKKIVLASTVNTVRKLLKNPIYNQIGSQPFVRIYGKFNKKSAQLISCKLKTFTVVKGPLQKLIPMNKENGVYMIAYNDNKNSLSIQSKLRNNPKNRNYFSKLVQKALQIRSPLLMMGMKIYNWKEGTHYYKPLKSEYNSLSNFIKLAQHPDKNIIVVGEMISKNQGWVEGALESVDKVF